LGKAYTYLRMPTCPACGVASDGAKFCGGCGQKMEALCSNCGAPVSGKWCGECGATAPGVGSPTAASSPSAARSQPAAPAASSTPLQSKGAIATTLGGGDTGKGFLAAPTVIVSSGGACEVKLDASNPRFIDGSNYRLKLANESVAKHVLGLWDAGIKSGTMGIVVTGVYTVLPDTSVTEDFVSFSMQVGESENMQGYWCASNEQGLKDVLSTGFKSANNVSFALDPMDAIRGNSLGPRQVLVAKLVMKNSRTINGKVVLPIGRGACPAFLVNYKK